MLITQGQTQDHEYLVCAIYMTSNLTRIGHVGIVLASSPFSAIAVAKRGHNPNGEKPIKYVASRILGSFKINMFSNQRYTCEELLSTRTG